MWTERHRLQTATRVNVRAARVSGNIIDASSNDASVFVDIRTVDSTRLLLVEQFEGALSSPISPSTLGPPPPLGGFLHKPRETHC